MHSCNYVVFEKFTCAYYHQIVLKSYYLNRIPLKCCMDYMQLHELALQRFHFVDCGQYVTMNINFRVIFTGFLKLLAISSL